MSEKHPTRVLVVDDHEVVRRGVRSLLQAKYDICGEAVDGQDALEKAQELNPSIVVMDISMPKLNGLEATPLIRNILPDCEVLILSQHESTQMAQQAFKAGARGYVVKSSIGRDLLAALEKVSRHESFFDPAIPSLGEASSHLDAQEALQRSLALERALRESEELYRTTFQSAGVGVAHVSSDGRWMRVNQKLCDIVGYSEPELLRMAFQDITHPVDVDSSVAAIEEMKNGKLDKYSVEKRYVRKDASTVWVNLTVSAVRDANGALKHFISVVEDIDERRVAEEAQGRLAAIVQSSDDAIVSKNLNGIITSWNAAAERIFGFTRDEAVGSPVTLIIPPELQDEEKQILGRLRKGERIDHFETVRITKSGRRLNVSLTISPVRDSSGRIVGASKIARDVSERKRIEDALHEGQLQLDLALEASKTALFDWDLVEAKGKWNEQMAAIYNFRPAEKLITAQEFRSLFHTDDVQRLADEAKRTLEESGRERFHFEYRTVRADGELRWIFSRGRILRNANGKPVRLIGTHTDITERKNVEQALQKSESRLRAAFGQAYSFLVLLEPDGTIIEANRAALEAAGCTREQVIGRKFWKPWWSPLPQEVEALKEAIKNAAEGRSVRGECYYSLADGTRRFADRTLNPVVEENGEVRMIVATALDITDQKKLRDELESRVLERTRELEEKNQALLEQAQVVREISGRLLHSQEEERRRIARELHDSSGQIIAALQMTLIPLEQEAQKQQPELAASVKESINLVEQLSKELRTVSYLLHPPLLDEAGLPSAIRWYVEGFSERSKIPVELEITPDFGRLSHELEMTVFRIIQECLTNIHRHANGQGATVHIARSVDEVLVEVQDNGKGFRGWSAGQNSSKTVREGVGIRGMRERVKQMGGTFEIRSSDSGTAVTAYFPLQRVEENENDAHSVRASNNTVLPERSSLPNTESFADKRAAS
jgi:PAS domain S-box-containing protein